ncbi:MAG: carboxypeptidase regulatory-like domain-containing protein, partial [Lysobacterales bacterium]
MSKSTRAARILLVLLAGWLLASSALAQQASMTLYVFKKGLPVANIEALVDGVVLGFTSEQGVVEFQVPPGLHRLELRDQDLVVLDQQIIAHEDEVSQWIVNITRGLSALTDVESSAPEGVVAGAPGASESDEQAGTGILQGRLVSAEDDKPVEGARIFISGQSRDIQSQADGSFTVELNAGDYSVSVLHSGFNTLTRDGIRIEADGETPVEFVLTPTGSELPEFVVIEPYIAGSLASVIEERRTEVAVANILGAEQISKAGDSDAAGALRRVTGLTLVDGRFIYVRGLGERYSSTLLNGANVPSPDATRRVVPLDLFPTGIIDSIAVKKGYTADLPGEFGGGTVELRTRSIPEEGFFDIELSLGYRDGTSFKDGLTYKGGDRDWTGYDDGTRQAPRELREAIADGVKLRPFNRFTGEGFTKEELEVIGESLSVNYDVTGDTISPNIGLTTSGGYVRELANDWRLGFLAALEYKDDWLTIIDEKRTVYTNAGGGELKEHFDYLYDTTARSIDLSGFVTAGLEAGENHKLSLNWMLLRNSTDKAQVWQGFNRDAEGGDVRFTELEWIERQMMASQVLGEHAFPALNGLELNWQYTFATAESASPDTRSYRYDPDTFTADEEDFIFSIRSDSNQRRWSDLEDESTSWNIGIKQPIEMFDGLDMDLLMGFNRVDKTRDSVIRRFNFKSRGSISGSPDLRRNLSVEDIIFDETIDPRGWQLEEVTLATDTYDARQVIDARYIGLDMNFGEVLRVAAGVRDESSRQAASTFNLFDPDRNPVVSELNTDDNFPYLTTTWFQGDHQVRFGYAETTNRPDFKELSESLYKDPLLDRLVKGNPDLEAAYITHYDVRWDYYFSPGEFISLGAFYKEFEDPIESVILASAEIGLTSFDNAELAENAGVEFELYKTLSFFEERWGWGAIWEKIYINTNFAWIDSEITLADDDSNTQTSNQRPLQGQSPYVWNFQVGYDDEDREINAA